MHITPDLPTLSMMKTPDSRTAAAALCLTILTAPAALQGAALPSLDWVRSHSGFYIGAVVPLPEGGVAVSGLGAAPDIPRNAGDSSIFVARLDEDGRAVAYARPRSAEGWYTRDQVGTLSRDDAGNLAIGGTFNSPPFWVGDKELPFYQFSPGGGDTSAFFARYDRDLKPVGAFGWHGAISPAIGESRAGTHVSSVAPWEDGLWVAVGDFHFTYDDPPPFGLHRKYNLVILDGRGDQQSLAELPLHQESGPYLYFSPSWTVVRTDAAFRVHAAAFYGAVNTPDIAYGSYRVFDLELSGEGVERLQWNIVDEVMFKTNFLVRPRLALDVRSDGTAFMANAFKGNHLIGGRALHSQEAYGLAVTKHNPDSGIQWIVQATSESELVDALFLAASPKGGVLVSGCFGSAPLHVGEFTLKCRGSTDGFLLHVSDDGHINWAIGFGGTGEKEGALTGLLPSRDRALAVDNAGHIYVCGQNLDASFRFGDQPVNVPTGGYFLARLSSYATPEPPRVKSVPANTVGRVGSEVTLRVEAEGTDLRFQWLKEGQPINGATNATLSLALARRSDGGSFSVLVSNAGGEVASDSVTVSVQVPQTIKGVRLSDGRMIVISFGDVTGEALPLAAAERFTVERSSDLRTWTPTPVTISIDQGLGQADITVPDETPVWFLRVREQ